MSRRRLRKDKPWILYRAATGVDRVAVCRRISMDDGERGVSRGAMRREYDSCGRHIGYRMIERTDSDLPSREASRQGITAREMELFAGRIFRRGKSVTERMSEEDRLTRVNERDGRRLPPEDDIELVAAKVHGWHPGFSAVR